MKLSQNFPLIKSLCLIRFVINARADVASGLALRGSDNYRELQENNCTYPGDVGWLFCSDTKFKCEDGFICSPQENTYVGVICVNTTCSTVPKPADDDTDNDDDVSDPDESCWEGECSSESDCEQDSICFQKGDSCSCRNPLYSSSCEKGTGTPKDSLCSLTKEPTPVLTKTPTSAPTQAPTPSPTPGPTLVPKSHSKPKKSKKGNGRHLSYVNDLRGNVP
jgi:hypothetical protein